MPVPCQCPYQCHGDMSLSELPLLNPCHLTLHTLVTMCHALYPTHPLAMHQDGHACHACVHSHPLKHHTIRSSITSAHTLLYHHCGVCFASVHHLPVYTFLCVRPPLCARLCALAAPSELDAEPVGGRAPVPGSPDPVPPGRLQGGGGSGRPQPAAALHAGQVCAM